ncbi:MAG: PAS domain S-box protein, partial [Desulfohalobiaceae bacterium]
MDSAIYRAFFDHAGWPFLLVSPQGEVVAANPAGHDLFGYPEGTLEGLDLERVLSAVMARTVPGLAGKDISECIFYESEGIRRSGFSIPLEIMACPIQGGSSRLVGVVLRDLREQKRVEARLSESEHRLRQVFEQADVGIVFQGPPGDPFLRVNNAYANMLGYSREELYSRSVEDITHPEDVEASLQLMRRVYDGRDGGNRSIEKRYLRRDGTLVWCRVTVSLVRQGDGEPWFLIAVVVDIGKQKQFEGELQHSLATNRKARQRLEAILASMPDGLLMLDDVHRVVEVNRHFQAICPSIMGLQPGTTVTSQCTHLPPALRGVVLRMSTKKQPVTDFRFPCRVGTGEVKHLSLNAAPVRGDGVDGMVFVVRDVTGSPCPDSDAILMRPAVASQDQASGGAAERR